MWQVVFSKLIWCQVNHLNGNNLIVGHFANAKYTVKIPRIILKFYSWGGSYILFVGFLQMLCGKWKFHGQLSISALRKVFWRLLCRNHLTVFPGRLMYEWGRKGILVILLISSAHVLYIQATLCLSFRPVEDIHRRRSSDQPNVFKSCVQNRAWRFGQGFVPGKVWKEPLLDKTVLDRIKQGNSSCSWTAGLFCLSHQCSKIQTQMQLIIHAMHSITCSFMWSGVSPLNHLFWRD